MMNPARAGRIASMVQPNGESPNLASGFTSRSVSSGFSLDLSIPFQPPLKNRLEARSKASQELLHPVQRLDQLLSRRGVAAPEEPFSARPEDASRNYSHLLVFKQPSCELL